MKGIELDYYNDFIEGQYLYWDKVEIGNKLLELLRILSVDIEDVNSYEFETAVQDVRESVENLSNGLDELSDVFYNAKNYLAKADKKWEEDV